MVLPVETEVETSSDTAPLSPEQVANAQAKNALLKIARAFSHDPDNFLAGEFDVMFDSLTLRCTQAATLLKWLHHDVCK